MIRIGRARALIGAAISIVALWLVLRSVDLAATADALRNADWRWMAVLVGFLCLDLAVRGLRWQRLLAPIARVPYLHTLSYLLVGYLFNNILPARLGELVRSHYAGDREGISRSTTLGTIVVERVIDLVAVVAIASVAILVLSVRGIVASAVLVGVAVAGLVAAVLAVGIAAHRLPGAERIAAWADRFPRVKELVGRLRDGLKVAGPTADAGGSAGAQRRLVGVGDPRVRGGGPGDRRRADDRPGVTAGVRCRAGLGDPGRPGEPRNVRAGGGHDRAGGRYPGSDAFAMALIAHVAILLTTSVGGVIALSRLGWPQRAPSSPTANPA